MYRVKLTSRKLKEEESQYSDLQVLAAREFAGAVVMDQSWRRWQYRFQEGKCGKLTSVASVGRHLDFLFLSVPFGRERRGKKIGLLQVDLVGG